MFLFVEPDAQVREDGRARAGWRRQGRLLLVTALLQGGEQAERAVAVRGGRGRGAAGRRQAGACWVRHEKAIEMDAAALSQSLVFLALGWQG